MRSFFIACFLLTTITGFSQTQSNQKNTTTFYLIRHAEKESSNPKQKNPKLTLEGEKRAKKWAELFSQYPIDFIFSTDFNRTRGTAQPIANALNINIELYNPRDLNNSDFQNKTKGKTSVIVGHSNTTPAFVNKIIKKDKYKPLEEDIFDQLFIVTIKDGVITDQVKTIDDQH